MIIDRANSLSLRVSLLRGQKYIAFIRRRKKKKKKKKDSTCSRLINTRCFNAKVKGDR